MFTEKCKKQKFVILQLHTTLAILSKYRLNIFFIHTKMVALLFMLILKATIEDPTLSSHFQTIIY